MSVPQQSTVPSVCRPQLWKAPAVTAVNRPSGAFSSPYSLRPQHSTAPSVRTAHEWDGPPAMAVNCPLGASLCARVPPPQHSMAPPGRSRPAPAATACSRSRPPDVAEARTRHLRRRAAAPPRARPRRVARRARPPAHLLPRNPGRGHRGSAWRPPTPGGVSTWLRFYCEDLSRSLSFRFEDVPGVRWATAWRVAGPQGSKKEPVIRSRRAMEPATTMRLTLRPGRSHRRSRPAAQRIRVGVRRRPNHHRARCRR